MFWPFLFWTDFSGIMTNFLGHFWEAKLWFLKKKILYYRLRTKSSWQKSIFFIILGRFFFQLKTGFFRAKSFLHSTLALYSGLHKDFFFIMPTSLRTVFILCFGKKQLVSCIFYLQININICKFTCIFWLLT